MKAVTAALLDQGERLIRVKTWLPSWGPFGPEWPCMLVEDRGGHRKTITPVWDKARFKFLTASLVSLMLLGGCAEGAARAINLGTSVADAGQNYLDELIATRIKIRDACMRMLENEVRRLENEGRYDEARALLARAYPPLSIVQAIDEKDASAIAQALNEARPCLVEPGMPD